MQPGVTATQALQQLAICNSASRRPIMQPAARHNCHTRTKHAAMVCHAIMPADEQPGYNAARRKYHTRTSAARGEDVNKHPGQGVMTGSTDLYGTSKI